MSKLKNVLSAKERILNAAIRLFSQKEYAGTTLDEIITEAKVGKGTVYKHFGTKEDLFHALIVEIQNQLIGHIKALPLNENLLTDFRLRIGVYLDFFAARPDYFFVRLQHLASTKASTRQFMLEQTHKFFANIEGDLVKKGIKGKLKEYPMEVFSFVTFSILNGYLYQFFHSGRKSIPESDLTMLTDILTSGILLRGEEAPK